MTFETFIDSLRLPQADSEKMAQDFRDRWNAMLDHRPPDRYADEFLAPEAVRRNWSLVPLPPESLGEVLAEAARSGDELLALRRGERRAGFVTWRCLGATELFAALALNPMKKKS